jgi:hypothetical protein
MNHPGRTPAASNPSTPPLNRTAALDWLNFRATSYVDMIPAYYSESKLLQSVTDCTLAKAEHTLSPTKKTSQTALVTYDTALRNVQESLRDRRLVQKPETLAAIQLLQIYEVGLLLNLSWSDHKLFENKLTWVSYLTTVHPRSGLRIRQAFEN